ncbi:probable purine permease 10 [Tripterygium wilfordii]|nr:probable purine permease 10 [Tripterygium wilfordii]
MHNPRSYVWWIRVTIYTVLVLLGQSVALLLGRQYFVKGGQSNWLAALLQLVGFPILIPFYMFSPFMSSPTSNETNRRQPSAFILASIYGGLGLFIAADCFLYSIGMKYLPVSTYTLISASQLGFNALFSFFLNSQKFTPFIVNSLVLLTISSILLVFQNESANPTGVSKLKYAIGFICTVGGSAGYGLVLSLTQLSFRKVIKRETCKAVMDLIFYEEFVASCAILIGLFASGDWKTLNREMIGYQLGKVSYIMNLVWTAVLWQGCAIGSVGLVYEVSSLFSNAIGVVGLPIVPTLAVIFFHDRMDGVKAVSMVLAIWGFASYVYQHYLDYCTSKKASRNSIEVSKASPTMERVNK